MKKRYPRGIMATACIPWADDFSFDEESFRQEVSFLLANGVVSIYLFGTAGEGYAVNREQFAQITAVFLNEMKRKQGSLPMVGIISLSMSEIIERIALGISLGANDFQISFPSWGAVSAEEGINFLKAVCGNFPDARFMHYNNGYRSKTRLSMEHYIEIADEIPNLVAVKNPGIDLMELQAFHSRELPIEFYNLEFVYGFANMLIPTGLLISWSNMNPKRARDYFEAGTRRDLKSITDIHHEFEIIDRIINENFPPGKIDGYYDKLFVKYNLPNFPLRLYPPYKSCSDEQFERFAYDIRNSLPNWANCIDGLS